MIYEFEKSFVRDFRKLNSKVLAKVLNECIQTISDANSINEIPTLKKLTGHKNAFRIRIGDYRIGVIINNDTITFVAFAHRKEIYRKFP